MHASVPFDTEVRSVTGGKVRRTSNYSFLVIAAHAGMKQTFVENNYVGGGFLGSSLHDNGGIITTGGATTPGISSTTANLGFEFHDVYDASQALSLGPDRQLLLAGYFFYNNEYSSFGAVGNVNPTTTPL